MAGLTACGGGGGSSGSGLTGSPPQNPAQEEEIHAQEITITQPANRAPRAVGAIPAQTLEQGGSTQDVDVAPFFGDPDGDSLTYSARSGDPGVVTAGMSGSTLTLTPVSPGNTTVTVTARDGHAEAVQTFPVTVPEPNRVPEAVGSIPAQRLTEGGNTISLDVAPYFSDPDGDSLTYSVQSGDPGIVRVSSSGSTITLTPVSPGNTTVTVTASDGHAEAVQTFPATIPEPNRVPEAVGTIPSQTLTEGGNTISLDVAPYFSDPDGDPLTWSAQSGDPDVVTAGMSGSTLTLTPVSPGNTTVTVTARDGYASALQTVSATVQQQAERPASAPATTPKRPPQPQRPTTREPEIALTGVNIVVAGSKSKTEHFPHTVFLRISPEPEGAQLSGFGFSVDPSGNNTGTFSFSDRIGDTVSIWFRCHRDFTGVATITFRGGSIVETFSVTCR